MKKIALALALLLSSLSAFAFPLKFQLDSVPVAQVVRLIYGEVLRADYVLDPDVLNDVRPISFRYVSDKGDTHAFLIGFLDSLGYRVKRVGTVDYVSRKPPESAPLDPDKDVFVYRPRYRDGSYLVDLLSPLFKGAFTSRRTVAAPPGEKSPTQAVPPGSALAMIDRVVDMLVFSGSPVEIDRLKKILAQVDVSPGEVLVKMVVYEVQTGDSEGSAFTLAASVLGGRLGASFGPTTALDSAVSFKVAGIQAVISALSNDSRFKIISSPSVRVRSGTQGKFVVGQDVPVLGALSYPQGAGQAVQSVAYQSSGVIFQITPTVRDSIVDVDLSQQMSSFAQTSTGVNGSPTLVKRQLDTSISVADGDLVLLGGLTEDKDSANNSGLSFLPAFMRAKAGSKSKTEILIVLQLNKI